MRKIRRQDTPRIRGRTRPLREPRGVGAWVLLAAALFATVGAVFLSLPTADSAEAPAALEVWLVRHAEKVDDSADPPLSPEGEARARHLAELLADAGIDAVHSTDYQRTRDTAGPVAEALGLEVELYDPRDPEGFLDGLRQRGGTHLVVGHSNTTPALVEALGGDPGSPIDESEYDRLYRVSVAADGTVESELRRFGG